MTFCVLKCLILKRKGLEYTQLTISSLPRVGQRGIPLASEGQSGTGGIRRLKTSDTPRISPVLNPTSVRRGVSLVCKTWDREGHKTWGIPRLQDVGQRGT